MDSELGHELISLLNRVIHSEEEIELIDQGVCVVPFQVLESHYFLIRALHSLYHFKREPLKCNSVAITEQLQIINESIVIELVHLNHPTEPSH